MKVKYVACTLNPDACPELTPEHREEINQDVPVICEMNAEYGFRQGLVKGMVIGGLAAFTGCTIGIIVNAKRQKKLNNDVKPKKKD